MSSSMFSTPGFPPGRFAGRRSGNARLVCVGTQASGHAGRGASVTPPLDLAEQPFVAEGDPLPPGDRSPDRRPLLDRLYRLQAPRLLRFFARRAGQEEADDLVNESFARFARIAQAAGPLPDDPEAYLQQIAKNVLRNRARAAYHRSVEGLDVGQEARGVDLTEALEARDLLERLEAALSRLGPKTRAIFMAHRLEGATYAEIAERTGLSVKGVEWHMSKAIALLHRSLRAR